MRLDGASRVVASALLVAVAAVTASIAFGSLRWLWAGERDNSIANYLPSLVVAVVAVLAFVRIWRRH